MIDSIKKIMNNRVVKAGSWYTFTNFFTKGIALLTLPIFTRLLSTTDYGIVSLFTSWAGIFSVIISLDLAWSTQRGKFEFKDDYNRYISSVVFLSLLIFSSFLLLFIIFSDFFSNITSLSKGLFFIMVFHSYFQFMHNLSFAKFQVEYKYKVVSIITIFSSIIGVLLSIYLIRNFFVGSSYLGRILGTFLPNAILSISFIFYFLLKGREFVNLNYWKYALVFSVPFILHNISGIINAQFDRIIINQYLGPSETGIYSFAYNVGMIVSVFFMSINQAYIPYYLEKMENREYKKILFISKNYRNLFIIFYSVILFISPEIVKLMAEKSYWEGLGIIPYIFLAYFFNFMYNFETNTEYYYKKTQYIPIGTMLAAAVNVILNYIFIPKYGYFAAAITTDISYFVLFVFHYLITKYKMKKPMFGLRFHLVSFFAAIGITLSFIIIKDLVFVRYALAGSTLIIGLIFLERSVANNE
ncbi:hypothetical protein X925_05145 [Petrotoga sp. 9T1HF07.CasAA.8.2]|uniref:oligosaccharide flippase family protein n=1 Tax=Petrotoga sp. 9T1HF07.CasAA.8.2 TaxID=1434329 RepID=UPI000CA748C7|nr:oligosaccharide flippase family protein [Petrotoga sp. 9T1HF07.CasAA.8.2]PNR88801.1 hypothetical protein X925_05145 [Petrotoga sp. 9T1HF07.CasAA.8.2]